MAIPEGAAAPAPQSAGPTLLIPEPPSGPSAEDRARLRQVAAATGDAADRLEVLPQPADSVADARAAVTEPTAETNARAEAGLVAALEERPAPSPEIEQLCADIRRAIRERRPPDEDSLLRSNPEREARRAGGEVEGTVRSDADGIRDDYNEMDNPPAATPAQVGHEVPPPPSQVPTPSPNATRATPDPVPAENVSLDADVAAGAQRIEDAGMSSPAAELVQGGPIAEARAAHGELAGMAATDPAQVLAEQQAARARARANMAGLEQRALAALLASRSTTVGAQTGTRGTMELSEEQQRTQAATRARNVFNSARTRVEGLLEPLPGMAMGLWNTGLEELSRDFEEELDRVERWKQERYAQTGGSVIEVWDELVGLPDWVIDVYDDAEREFGDGVCDLLREISRQVNGIIATCEQIIADADREIARIFSALPESLREWADGQQAHFREQLAGLHERVTTTRDDLTNDLADRGAQAVQEVRERIQELRVAAGGLVGRIEAAIQQFLEDPARFIINGLLELVGIAAGAFWALVDRIQSVIQDIAEDPLGFANNLAAAIGQGFQRFFDNFGTHILSGFFDWLFSGLGAVGVTLPGDFSPASLVTFFLELMGITWERIRGILARHIGEQNMALIEQAVGLLIDLIQMGPTGLFEMIKERLSPRDLIQQVIQAGVEFLVETLITRVAARLVMMFNPAGAILQAIEVIYRILAWIFNNAARIFSLVETVVNGAAALIAGNISGMAVAVEGALARLIAPVIDFLAGFLGLGALPDRIADTIRGFQQWILGIIERIIDAIASRARALLQRLGIGGRGGRDGRRGEHGEDTELGETIRFMAGGERQRLWVTREARGGTIYVASRPWPLIEVLEDWSTRAEQLPTESPPQGGRPPRAEARSLLIQAGMLLRAADSEADGLALQWRQAQDGAGGSLPSDDVLEAQERDLAQVIRRLLDLLGITGGQCQAPGTSAPGIGNVATHRPGQPPRNTNGPSIHITQSEHIIPFATARNLRIGVRFDETSRRVLSRFDRGMLTIMIYRGAAARKDAQDNVYSAQFSEQMHAAGIPRRTSQAKQQYYGGNEREAEELIGEVVSSVTSALRRLGESAIIRTQEAIRDEWLSIEPNCSQTNGERRGETTPEPAFRLVAATANRQLDGIIDMVEDALQLRSQQHHQQSWEGRSIYEAGISDELVGAGYRRPYQIPNGRWVISRPPNSSLRRLRVDGTVIHHTEE